MKSDKYDEIMSGLMVTDEMKERLMERLENEDLIPENVERIPLTYEDGTGGGDPPDMGKEPAGENNSDNRKAIYTFARRMGLVAAACFLLVVGFSFGALLRYDSHSSPKDTGSQASYEAPYNEYEEEMDASEPMVDEEENISENAMADGDVPMTEGNKEKAAATEPSQTGGSLPVEMKGSNPVTGTKVVYRCELTIETEAYLQSMKDLNRSIESKGGYIESEYEHDFDSYIDDNGKEQPLKRNELIIRIPKDQYRAFVAEAEKLGTIKKKQQSANNISRSYADNEVQIKALKIQEKRLLAMMDQAETIQDMITVEDRLTEVQKELESYQSYKADMDDLVDYSTVTMELKETNDHVKAGQPEDPDAAITAITMILLVILLAIIIAGVSFFGNRRKGKETPSK